MQGSRSYHLLIPVAGRNVVTFRPVTVGDREDWFDGVIEGAPALIERLTGWTHEEWRQITLPDGDLVLEVFFAALPNDIRTALMAVGPKPAAIEEPGGDTRSSYPFDGEPINPGLAEQEREMSSAEPYYPDREFDPEGTEHEQERIYDPEPGYAPEPLMEGQALRTPARPAPNAPGAAFGLDLDDGDERNRTQA